MSDDFHKFNKEALKRPKESGRHILGLEPWSVPAAALSFRHTDCAMYDSKKANGQCGFVIVRGKGCMACKETPTRGASQHVCSRLAALGGVHEASSP